MMNQRQGHCPYEDRIHPGTDRLDEAIKKQEQRIRNLEKKAVQNVNLYFIFQAGILASATTLRSSMGSDNWWIPFAPSLIAAITNLLSFITTMSKVLKSREQLDQNILDLAFMKLYPITIDQLSQSLPGTPLNHQGDEIARPKASSLEKWKNCLVVYLYVSLFIGFSAAVMYGSHSILCHQGERK